MDPARPWKTVKTREGELGSAWHRQEEAQQEIKTVSIRNLLIPATSERVNWWILQLFILQFPPAWFSYISPPFPPLITSDHLPGRDLSPHGTRRLKTRRALWKLSQNFFTGWGGITSLNREDYWLSVFLNRPPCLRERRTDQSMRRHWLREPCCSSLI